MYPECPLAGHLHILAKVTLTLWPMVCQSISPHSPHMRSPRSFLFPISLWKDLVGKEAGVTPVIQAATPSSAIHPP